MTIRSQLVTSFALLLVMQADGLAAAESSGISETGCSQTRVAEGCGTYVWPDGTKYVGGFRGELANGHGTIYFPDGSKLEALFENGRVDDDATFVKADGTQVSGSYQDATPDSSRPRVIPRYPFWRALLGGQAEVQMSIILDAAGTVQTLQIDRPTGSPSFEAAAIEVVKQWKYLPATIGGRPVPALTGAILHFAQP